MREKRFKKGIMLFIVCSLVISSVLMDGAPKVQADTDTFSGGDGSAENPYQIGTAGQLNEVRNHLDAHFRLVADLDLSDYADGEGWEPIGTGDAPFTGTLHGGGHTIANLTINRDEDYQGLFGYVEGGTIRNLILAEASVDTMTDDDPVGKTYVGLLAGRISSAGSVANVDVSGDVSGHEHVGGLIGSLGEDGRVSHATADVEVRGWENFTGGLIGNNAGEVSYSRAFGKVEGRISPVPSMGGLGVTGGLIGRNQVDGRVSDSYATGDVYVHGVNIANGGLIGRNDGEVTRSYATGDILSESHAGGLIGQNEGSVTDVYATGSLTDSLYYASGLISLNRGTVLRAYATGEVAGSSVSGLAANFGGSIEHSFYFQAWDNGHGTHVSEEDMKQKETYTEADWDFETVWALDEGYNDGFPHLRVAVTYDGNGHTGGVLPTDGKRYAMGESVTVQGHDDLVREGYTFDGWTTSMDGSGTVYREGDTFPITEHTVLYAQWSDVVSEVDSLTDIRVGAGTALADIGLPQEVEVTLASGSTMKLAVTWDDGDPEYDRHRAGTYTFTGTLDLPEGVENPDHLTAMVDVRVERGSDGGGGSSGGGGSPSPAPRPTTEEVPVVVDGVEDAKELSELFVIRTTEPNGTSSDELELSEAFIASLLEQRDHSEPIRFLLPDGKDVSQVTITVTEGAGALLEEANVDVEFITSYLGIFLPSSSMADFTEDLRFELKPMQEEELMEQVRKKALQEGVSDDPDVKLLFMPVTVTTNVQGRSVGLTLPVPEVAEANREDIVVFIEHSDGEQLLVPASFVPYAGEEAEEALTFEVDKFSTFTAVQLAGWSERIVDEQEKVKPPYIEGYPDGTFRPNEAVTRAQMAAMLGRHLGIDEKSGGTGYIDVSDTHWAYEEIAVVEREGIMHGHTNGQFRPEEAISRAQMAVIAYRWLTEREIECCQEAADGDGAPYRDVDPNHWAKEEIEAIREWGLMEGFGDNSFLPAETLTRAQAVTVLNRLFERDTTDVGTTPSFSDVPVSHWAFNNIEAAARNE
ncbi:S-layer homology domain-containing protein [Halalkalibacter oceani]|uniref:S-layer homology domain-containing protein n=1 Tax=Halalkalibacter oceani TaxID=1653776 RepID=UPI00339645FB